MTWYRKQQNLVFTSFYRLKSSRPLTSKIQFLLIAIFLTCRLSPSCWWRPWPQCWGCRLIRAEVAEGWGGCSCSSKQDVQGAGRLEGPFCHEWSPEQAVLPESASPTVALPPCRPLSTKREPCPESWLSSWLRSRPLAGVAPSREPLSVLVHREQLLL